MLKLYKFIDNKKYYWETWPDKDGAHVLHWGLLGTTGDTDVINDTPSESAKDIIQSEIDKVLSLGYKEISQEEHVTLLIEYEVDGMGDGNDVEKRHQLEDRMNNTLGWAGLGSCDGGSIGSGAMEVCNFVVDFELAKEVIENDLKDTEFENYTRIYQESE